MEKESEQKKSRPNSRQIKRVIRRREIASEVRITIYKAIRTLIVIAAVIVLLATLFFPTVAVRRGTMIPTLLDGERIVFTTIGSIGNGDIIAFNLGNRTMVKRVIAVPGQRVEIDEHGVVYVDREPIEELYVTNLALGICDITMPMQVPDNQYFVMGDNRAISIDSRTMEFGTVHKDEIIGKAVFKIWPLNRIGLVP